MASSSNCAPAPPLNVQLHVKYIQSLDQRRDFAFQLTEHLRINGIYWGLTALHILGHPDALNNQGIVEYTLSCWDDEIGAFGAGTGHDGHILGTLSALQILVMVGDGAIDRINKERVVNFLLDRVGEDGQVSGDQFGETDSRFAYVLVQALSLLGCLEKLETLYDGTGKQRVVDNLVECMNFDGAFGTDPGAESHGGQVWVCTAALAILDELDRIDGDLLGSWLSERQTPGGGLNGRPEKLEDVCYSWWDLASLSIIDKLHWINRHKLIDFILRSQDLEGGGIADRPDDWVDVFHTVFGSAGLSLLGYPALQDIDPLYCMPADIINNMGLRKPYTALPRLTAYSESVSSRRNECYAM